MKRFFCLILALGLLIGLCACTNDPDPTTDSSAPTERPSVTLPPDLTLPSDTSSPTDESTEQPTQEPTREPTQEPSQSDEPYRVTYNAGLSYRVDGEMYAQAIISVKNTGNTPLFLGMSAITLTNQGGESAIFSGVIGYPQVIDPGETGYYFDSGRVSLSAEGEQNISYSLNIRTASTQEQSGLKRYDIIRSSLRDSVYGGMTLTGYVNYTGGAKAWGIYVACVLFDADGKPVSLMYSLVDLPATAATLAFDVSNFTLPPALKAARIERFEVFAYPIIENPGA